MILLLVWQALLSPASSQENSAHPDDARLSAEFQNRAKQYVEFRQKIAGKPPKPREESSEIAAEQHELAQKIRVARARAKQGEIFTPSIAQYFRQQIAASLVGPYGKEIRASMRHAEPVKMELEINHSYPDKVPLQSTPPTLLLNLPPLTDGLEYRLLDRELVLRDAEANLIIDYVPNAVPVSAK